MYDIYIYMCFAKGSHMFSHVLHIRCTYTSHRHYIRFTHVNVYVSYASFAQIALCCTCGLHMFCMRKTVRICIRTPRQALLDGSLEAFWDSANIYIHMNIYIYIYIYVYI